MLSVIQSVAKNLLSLCIQGKEILRYALNDGYSYYELIMGTYLL